MAERQRPTKEKKEPTTIRETEREESVSEISKEISEEELVDVRTDIPPERQEVQEQASSVSVRTKDPIRRSATPERTHERQDVQSRTTTSQKTRVRRDVSAKQIDVEADLFASIATIDNLSRSFARGMVNGPLYKRQLQGLIKDAFKARMKLNQMDFELTEFIEANKLAIKYPNGLQKLELFEGTSDIEGEELQIMPYESLRQLPAQSADYVANAIELIDLLRLRSIARIDMIVPLLEDMIHILPSFPTGEKDDWVVDDITKWKLSLENLNPDEILDEETATRLEFQAVRWMNDFRRRLKSIR
ncbi:MAG: hypothetical protein ACTSYA_12285 [Candidatus Kariarchaeaceae archaeon]